jgi:hypothetical protein
MARRYHELMVKRYRPPNYDIFMLLMLLLIPLTWPIFAVPWLMARPGIRTWTDQLPEWVEIVVVLGVLYLNYQLVEHLRHLW